MIDLYTWTTPNGRKVSIMLEELGVEYNVHPIEFSKGMQREPEFLQIGPNNKIPVIVDQDTGQSVMESGAIMIYLADKYGKFLPKDGAKRTEAMEWLMWQMAGLGPICGQAHAYLHFNPGEAPFAEERLKAEVTRLYGVLDRRLEGREFICDEYSIVDMACWPWVSRYEWHKADLSQFPNVRAWYQRLLARDAVQKGYHVPKITGEIPTGE
jgi:GST-like protein